MDIIHSSTSDFDDEFTFGQNLGRRLSCGYFFAAVFTGHWLPFASTCLGPSLGPRNSSLGGTTDPKSHVAFSWATFRDRSFQDYIEWAAGERLLGREALIRWTNEVHFRVFHETTSPRSNLSVGQHYTLFEGEYLKEYFLDLRPRTGRGYRTLQLLVGRLKEIPTSLSANG